VNRRLVLGRLLEYRGAKAFGVLQLAVADPDQTVRRKAIRLLADDGSREAVQLLRRLAAGEIYPRVASRSAKDYSEATGNCLDTVEMKEQEFSDTDSKAAEEAIKTAGR
jgi:HEAT repeat protein